MSNTFLAYQMIGRLGPITRSELAAEFDRSEPGRGSSFIRALERLSVDLLIKHGERRFCRVTKRLTKTWVIDQKKPEARP